MSRKEVIAIISTTAKTATSVITTTRITNTLLLFTLVMSRNYLNLKSYNIIVTQNLIKIDMLVEIASEKSPKQ